MSWKLTLGILLSVMAGQLMAEEKAPRQLPKNKQQLSISRTESGESDMPTVSYNGEIHQFPDSWDNAKISAALKAHKAGTAVKSSGLTASEEGKLGTAHYNPDGYKAEDTSGLLKLNKKQEAFRAGIQRLETGGQGNAFVRTSVVEGEGSSAYGTYQITADLVSRHKGDTRFTEEERAAMERLLERQNVALQVGGKDRARYSAGGSDYAATLRLSKQYGYDSPEEFLDDFDYGGTLGLADNADFRVAYENIGRKLLNATLKAAGGNLIEAATLWHGGADWKKSKYRKSTEQYREKAEIIFREKEKPGK